MLGSAPDAGHAAEDATTSRATSADRLLVPRGGGDPLSRCHTVQPGTRTSQASSPARLGAVGRAQSTLDAGGGRINRRPRRLIRVDFGAGAANDALARAWACPACA